MERTDYPADYPDDYYARCHCLASRKCSCGSCPRHDEADGYYPTLDEMAVVCSDCLPALELVVCDDCHHAVGAAALEYCHASGLCAECDLEASLRCVEIDARSLRTGALAARARNATDVRRSMASVMAALERVEKIAAVAAAKVAA